jgi:hypothetical protein
LDKNLYILSWKNVKIIINQNDLRQCLESGSYIFLCLPRNFVLLISVTVFYTKDNIFKIQKNWIRVTLIYVITVEEFGDIVFDKIPDWTVPSTPLVHWIAKRFTLSQRFKHIACIWIRWQDSTSKRAASSVNIQMGFTMKHRRSPKSHTVQTLDCSSAALDTMLLTFDSVYKKSVVRSLHWKTHRMHPVYVLTVFWWNFVDVLTVIWRYYWSLKNPYGCKVTQPLNRCSVYNKLEVAHKDTLVEEKWLNDSMPCEFCKKYILYTDIESHTFKCSPINIYSE